MQLIRGMNKTRSAMSRTTRSEGLWLRRVSVALLALIMALAGSGLALAAVSTDSQNYFSGQTATIAGDGMAPGETVGVDILDPDGLNVQRHEVTADEGGNFSDTYAIPSDAKSGVYTVVATGLTSGTVFTATFYSEQDVLVVMRDGDTGGPFPVPGFTNDTPA